MLLRAITSPILCFWSPSQVESSLFSFNVWPFFQPHTHQDNKYVLRVLQIRDVWGVFTPSTVGKKHASVAMWCLRGQSCLCKTCVVFVLSIMGLLVVTPSLSDFNSKGSWNVSFHWRFWMIIQSIIRCFIKKWGRMQINRDVKKKLRKQTLKSTLDPYTLLLLLLLCHY